MVVVVVVEMVEALPIHSWILICYQKCTWLMTRMQVCVVCALSNKRCFSISFMFVKIATVRQQNNC